MPKSKPVKYCDHPYVNGLMVRTLGEKRLRPELIDSVARTIEARCEEIRSSSSSYIAAVISDPEIQNAIALKLKQLKEGKSQ